jgi:hypothetical protein
LEPLPSNSPSVQVHLGSDRHEGECRHIRRQFPSIHQRLNRVTSTLTTLD